MVRPLRSQTHTGAIIQPEPSLFLLLLWHLQPFAPPYPLDPLVVHMPTSVVQKAYHHAVAIAPVLISQFDDVVGQTFFIGPALGHLALRRAMLTKRPAGTTLRNA